MRFNFLYAAASLALGIISYAAGNPIVVGYYPSWKRQYMSSVDFSKYTHVNMAFAIPSSSGSFSFEGEWFLPQVVTDLHSKGSKVLMSVGGWTGSNLFSTILKNPSTRTNMLNSMANYVKSNNLDGIDIDWEYPGRLGNNCNVFDPQADTRNFLTFLQDLRKKFDSDFGVRKKLITLAVRVQPFDGPNGPVTDVSEFAKVVDFANLMQYDINGGWNNVTGPNAPFNFEKGKGMQVSFVSAIDEWTKAGWPAGQLTAGIGFYGRATQALVDMTQDPDNQYQAQSSVVPLGDSEDAPWYDACAGATANSGTWQWKHLRNQGVLSSATTANAPWVRYWDDVSKTPWVFNKDTRIFISYDDTDSIKAKVGYAASKGLAGAMIWSMNMDYNNELLNAVLAWNGGGLPSHTEETPNPTSTRDIPDPTSTDPTSEPSTSTNDDGGPVNGGACSSEGKYQCAKSSGSAAGFFICLNGRWISQSCGSGTVCLQNGSSISCGWPQ